MAYFDQHVHTYFSFDSTEQFEAYLAQTAGPFVTTEHLEFSNPDAGGADNAPDYAAYVAKLDQLKRQFPNQLLRGVEVGYFEPRAADLAAYVTAHDYDLILFSIHHDGTRDFQDRHFRSVPQRAHVVGYYERMLSGLTAFTQADVLAHFDYGLRVLDVTPAQLEEWAEPQLRAILALTAERGMAFEVNTKSMFQWGNQALYELVLPWFLAAGGTRVTLGSDAHTADKYQTDFDAAKAMLRKIGVRELTTYQRHVPTQTAY